MMLLSRVAELLFETKIDFVVIGASAMAVYGVSRSTYDFDLMTIDPQALHAATWAVLENEGIEVDLRYGDVQDPLRGVVRLEAREQRPVDLIVGHGGWQTRIFEHAGRAVFEGVELPVVGQVDLILLKIYAGGPQDLWDVRQLLDRDQSQELQNLVSAALEALPTDLQTTWSKVVEGQP
jgi:hypothetical protein